MQNGGSHFLVGASAKRRRSIVTAGDKSSSEDETGIGMARTSLIASRVLLPFSSTFKISRTRWPFHSLDSQKWFGHELNDASFPPIASFYALPSGRGNFAVHTHDLGLGYF